MFKVKQNSCRNSTKHGPDAGNLAEWWLFWLTELGCRMLKSSLNQKEQKTAKKSQEGLNSFWLTICSFCSESRKESKWLGYAISHLSEAFTKEHCHTMTGCEENAPSCSQSYVSCVFFLCLRLKILSTWPHDKTLSTKQLQRLKLAWECCVPKVHSL